MFFKNLFLYRTPAPWALSAEQLEEQLARMPLQRCGSLDMESSGWVSPTGDGALVYASHGQLLIALGNEQRLLPSAVIKDAAKERAEQIEARQGYPVGRRQLREIKDQITHELMPRAFTRRSATRAWIAPAEGWLVIEASAPAKADMLIELLRHSLDDLPAKLLQTRIAPSSAMTRWIAGAEPPHAFTVDMDLELRSPTEDKATVRYVRHSLEGDDIRRHVTAGKQAVRLGMTWQDKISFVLDEELRVKRVKFLDILDQDSDAQVESPQEQFDIEFTLMTGEMLGLLDDLVAALGGEKTDAPDGAARRDDALAAAA